jgi:hypothetical protein
MAIPKPQLVRLIAAVLGSAGACWFTVLYTHISRIRFEFDHQGGRLTAVNEILTAHGCWLFVFPVVALVIGLWLLQSRPQFIATFEVHVSVVWLLSLAVAGFCLLTWQVQNIPTFSHMEWHF